MFLETSSDAIKKTANKKQNRLFFSIIDFIVSEMSSIFYFPSAFGLFYFFPGADWILSDL